MKAESNSNAVGWVCPWPGENVSVVVVRLIHLTDLKVRVRLEGAPSSIRSVQQQRPLADWEFRDGVLTFGTDLEWADYFLLLN